MSAPIPVNNEWRTGLIALGSCILVLPISKFVGTRWNLFSEPGPLDIHTRPITRMGGVGIIAGLAVVLAMDGIGRSRQGLLLTLAILTIWATGLIDDLLRLSPVVRLILQTIAVALLWQAGWRIQLPLSIVLSMVAEWLFVLSFVNAFNLLDGSDGLAAGITAIIALSYIVLPGAETSWGMAIAWGLLGTCTGFLFFNFPPAKMFMGDSGSTTLGFLVAFLGLDFYDHQTRLREHLAFPLLVAALPLSDLVCAVLRRTRSGVSPFLGDRRHFYDLLLQRGWRTQQVAFISYATTVILGAVAWLCDGAKWSVLLPVLFVLLIFLFAVADRLGMLRRETS